MLEIAAEFTYFTISTAKLPFHVTIIKVLITVGRELRQQHPSDLLSGAGTSRERSSRDVPAGQQITRVLLP